MISIETGELDMEVQDVVNREPIKEILSPCVVPIVLELNKGGEWRILLILHIIKQDNHKEQVSIANNG